MRAAVLAFSLAALGPPLRAATIHVPSDHPTLGLAVAAAAPGDVIVVHGGVHPPVTIDKALHLVGEPSFTIDNSSVFGANPAVEPAIRLAGGGAGRVTLSRMVASGQADVFQFVGGQPLVVEGAISGGGFEELFVLDCVLEPCQWALADDGWFDGVPAIDVTVSNVHVSRSEITGGHGFVPSCIGASSVPPAAAAPGIAAVGATVVTLDSIVRGGDAAEWCFGFFGSPCPTLPDPNVTGGAPAVAADRLLTAGSILLGGSGAVVLCAESGAPVPIGAVPPGPAHAVNDHVPLPGSLGSGSPLVLGAPWTLTWAPSDPYVLLAASGPSPPTPLGIGWSFLDPGGLVVAPVSAGSAPVTVSVPDLPALVGEMIAVQLYGPSVPLSRPYVGPFVP